MKTSTQRRQLTLLLILATVLAGVPTTVCAQNSHQPWSTVATAGEPDESSQALVDYNGSSAYIKSSAPASSTVTIRYRVSPVDGLFFTSCKSLKVRFLDDGDAADIRIVLRQTNIDTGALSTPLTFNSVSFPGMRGFQTQYGLCVDFTFDFTVNTYYLEVVMTRSAGPHNVRGNVGLQIMQITTNLI